MVPRAAGRGWPLRLDLPGLRPAPSRGSGSDRRCRSTAETRLVPSSVAWPAGLNYDGGITYDCASATPSDLERGGAALDQPANAIRQARGLERAFGFGSGLGEVRP